ncbi:hypothetical protein ABT009_29840 [Streptomyces sp. NPDC002896]|uniref:hypothetical protein n=1 Tax=Streptomyces sp. NPDC002896 TaxID=3154438 RepID=UPI00333490F4
MQTGRPTNGRRSAPPRAVVVEASSQAAASRRASASRCGALGASRPGALQAFTGTLLTNWTERRLRLGRYRAVAGGSVTGRSSAVFVPPSLNTVVDPLPAFADPDGSDFEPVSVWERAGSNVDEYLRVFGRPEQVAAWRESRA